jgi:hypothetical protein
MRAIDRRSGNIMSQSSVRFHVSFDFTKISADHSPQLNRRFSFRLVYILKMTNNDASSGVPYITPRQVS